VSQDRAARQDLLDSLMGFFQNPENCRCQVSGGLFLRCKFCRAGMRLSRHEHGAPVAFIGRPVKAFAHPYTVTIGTGYIVARAVFWAPVEISSKTISSAPGP